MQNVKLANTLLIFLFVISPFGIAQSDVAGGERHKFIRGMEELPKVYGIVNQSKQAKPFNACNMMTSPSSGLFANDDQLYFYEHGKKMAENEGISYDNDSQLRLRFKHLKRFLEDKISGSNAQPLTEEQVREHLRLALCKCTGKDLKHSIEVARKSIINNEKIKMREDGDSTKSQQDIRVRALTEEDLSCEGGPSV